MRRTVIIVSAAISSFLFLALQFKPGEMYTVKSDDETQQRLDWLRENAIRIRSKKIKKPKSRDLMPLKEKIGDARIVMLGEQDHGYGTSQEFKGRLIRFLHEEMGFNVLAWESGLYCCRLMDEAFQQQDVSLQDAVDLGVFGVFGWVKQNRPLFEYIWNDRNSEHPLIQVGFDCQFSATSSFFSFPEWVESYFDNAEIGLLDQERMDELVDQLNVTAFYAGSDLYVSQLLAIADYLVKAHEDNYSVLSEHYDHWNLTYGYQVLKNFREFCYAELMSLRNQNDPWSYTRVRDKAMGETLILLANDLYKDEKIIVWAHTFHNSRNVTAIDSYQRYNLNVMGDWVYKALGDQVYSIAPITYEGESEWVYGRYHYDISPAETGTPAWYFHELGRKYYFLDLKSLPADNWLRTAQRSRLIRVYMTAEWPRVVDALLYIEKTKPCTPVEEHAGQVPQLTYEELPR